MASWDNGLCGCRKDMRTCCMATYAPCFVEGINAKFFNEDPLFFGLSYMFFKPIVGAKLREKIRSNYGIQGNYCEDCSVHFFCSPCALTQEFIQLYGYTNINVEMKR